MEVDSKRIQFAREHLGVQLFVDTNDDPVAHLRSLLHGDLPTIVFDATGSARSMTAAPQFVANGGKLVFVGLVQGQLTFDDPEFHRREMTLLRSRNATANDFAAVIHLLESGTVNIAPWITHRTSPEALAGVLPGWLHRETGVLKGILEW
ncbi:MAG: hypothetical protein NVS2B7_11190 [Herpetosiphon sp.]